MLCENHIRGGLSAFVPLTHWDSIARNNAELPLPEWQKTELDRRYSDYKNGKLKLHNWDVIHEELGNKYK